MPDCKIDANGAGQGNFAVAECTFTFLDGGSATAGAQIVIHESAITNLQNIAYIRLGAGPQDSITFGSTSTSDWTFGYGFTGWNPGYLKFLLDGTYKGSFTDTGLLQWAGTETDPSFYVDTTGEMRTKKPLYPPTYGSALQSATSIVAGAGVPVNASGTDGQFYLRSDGVAGNAIYQRRVGVWVAVA